MIVLQQMMIFFIMIFLGILARRYGMITSDNQRQLSAIVVNIAAPALVLSGALGATGRMSGNEILFSFGVSIGLLVVTIIIAKVLPAILRFPQNERGAVNLMVVFSNIAFMGIPLLASVYGERAIIYITFFLIPFNVLFYTYGIQTISRRNGTRGKFEFKKMINPGVIASFVTLALYFSNLTLPYIVTESVKMVGRLTGPLAMMLIGASLFDIRVKGLFTDMKLILFTLLKMLVFPVVILLILKQFVHNQALLGACLVMLATPAGNMIAMFATLYNKDSYEVATKGISLTTAVSVITLPIVSLITGIC